MNNNRCGPNGGRGDPPWMYGSRGDPPIVHGARGHPPWKYASRGDPPIRSGSGIGPPEYKCNPVSSIIHELILRELGCKNSSYGRGMPKIQGFITNVEEQSDNHQNVIAIPSNREKQSDSNVDQMDRITRSLKDCFIVPPRNDENRSISLNYRLNIKL